MEGSKKRQTGSSSSSSSWSSSNSSSSSRSSSSSGSIGHLFGPPKEHYYSYSPSSASSYSTESSFGSIFPPPSAMVGRDSSHSRNQDLGNQFGIWNQYGDQANINQVFKGEGKGRSSTSYQHEIAEPSYLSSSIHYGGQENYSPRTRTSESQHMFKKDGGDDDSNGNSESASRGNWWQGSLYY